VPVDANATNAFKANPLTFLNTALILAPIGNALRHNRSEHLGLGPSPYMGSTAVDTAGNALALWQVVKAQPGEAYFRSYIADYEQGATTYTTLGSNEHAEFCFTANMNGCTFGHGNHAPDGTLVVSHGNAANTGAHPNFDSSVMTNVLAQSTALQTAIQYTRAKQGHGVGGRVFEPEHYRIGARQSVTFGYRPRGAGAWTFYFIGYTRGGGGAYTSYGVQPMPTNVIT
jgi:hypothetical protein